MALGQIGLGRRQDGGITPHRVGKAEEHRRGLHIRGGEVPGQDCRPGRGVGPAGSRRVAETGRRAGQRPRGHATEDHHPGDQDHHRLAYHPFSQPGVDSGPGPVLTSRSGGPEHGSAEDGEEGRKQGQTGQEHETDRDRQGRTQALIEGELGQHQAEECDDHRHCGERDRLSDRADGLDHRRMWLEAPPELLPDAKDKEEAVVGARPQHQDDQKHLGYHRNLDPDVGGFGDHRTREREHQGRGQEGDERSQQSPEGDQKESDDEHHREELGQVLGALR